MIDEKKLKEVVKRRCNLLDIDEIELETKKLLNQINDKYNFSKYTTQIITTQEKKRKIYRFDDNSCEDILCQYLKEELKSEFNVKSMSRSKIMKLLFNVLPVVKDLEDFVIVRADFKSFFDTVLVEHIYETYIKKSSLKRYYKEIFEEYKKCFKYCHAGLCLSNIMTEIVCNDFDALLKARLSKYGVFFYERYVDDFIVIMNKYVSEKVFLEILNSTIREVFGDSKVELADEPDKFKYIARRDFSNNPTVVSFSFLGYKFEIESEGNKSITFKYGVTQNKIDKYSNLIEQAIIQYSKDNNVELLRQKIKLYSVRVVIGKKLNDNYYSWIVNGFVGNYNELRYHMNDLTTETEKFMKNRYFDLFKKHNITKIPYFLKDTVKNVSIYNIYHNMNRNRTIIFQENIGVPIQVLLKWINKIDENYDPKNKTYYKIVLDYLNLLKKK